MGHDSEFGLIGYCGAPVAGRVRSDRNKIARLAVLISVSASLVSAGGCMQQASLKDIVQSSADTDELVANLRDYKPMRDFKPIEADFEVLKLLIHDSQSQIRLNAVDCLGGFLWASRIDAIEYSARYSHELDIIGSPTWSLLGYFYVQANSQQLGSCIDMLAARGSKSILKSFFVYARKRSNVTELRLKAQSVAYLADNIAPSLGRSDLQVLVEVARNSATDWKKSDPGYKRAVEFARDQGK